MLLSVRRLLIVSLCVKCGLPFDALWQLLLFLASLFLFPFLLFLLPLPLQFLALGLTPVLLHAPLNVFIHCFQCIELREFWLAPPTDYILILFIYLTSLFFPVQTALDWLQEFLFSSEQFLPFCTNWFEVVVPIPKSTSLLSKKLLMRITLFEKDILKLANIPVHLACW